MFAAIAKHQFGYLRPLQESSNRMMNKIKDIREAQKLTQADLGDLMETTAATVQRLETGNRELTEKWIRRFAKALEVSPSEILGDFVPAEPNGLPVNGEVQAGIWKEVFSGDEAKYPPLPIGPDPRYPSSEQYALKVIGSSMDKVFPEGQFIVCVSWASLGRVMRDRDLVVVQRTDNGRTESTVKRARIVKGNVTLMPESTDPHWQKPVEMGKDSSEEVTVTALVIGRYEPL
jgi:transcriptional regulator with XRE-family HTH domain